MGSPSPLLAFSRTRAHPVREAMPLDVFSAIPRWRLTRDLLPSPDVIRLCRAAGQLPVDAQCVGGALFPGERSSGLDGPLAETEPPIVILDDAPHSRAPTIDVQRFD